MRVLQVYRDYFSVLHGGIERHVREIAHGLQPDIRTEVLAAGRKLRGGVVREEDVLIHMAPELVRIHGLPLCPTFGRLMDRGNYDLIHLHLPTPMGQLGYALSGRRASVIATYHADLHRGPAQLRAVYNQILLKTLPTYRKVITSSWELVSSSPVLSRLRQRHPELIEVIPFGVDTDRFTPEPTNRSAALRNQWGGGPIILFVGRLADYKGLGYLIEAMRDVDANLVIAGVGVGHDRVVTKGNGILGVRFIYLGDVPEEDLPHVYRAADIFCLPSISSAEAFGLAALEALASGLPTITTEVGTATSVINTNEVTGLVIEPANAYELRVALQRLLSNDAWRAQLGSRARRRVLEHYDRAHMVQRVRKVIESTVG